jgi:hypothetical protein
VAAAGGRRRTSHQHREGEADEESEEEDPGGIRLNTRSAVSVYEKNHLTRKHSHCQGVVNWLRNGKKIWVFWDPWVGAGCDKLLALTMGDDQLQELEPVLERYEKYQSSFM